MKHVSHEALSTYRPGQPGCDFKPEVAPRGGERVLEKSTSNAFIGTPLETELRAAGASDVVITGVITNNSVEATARMSGNLGFPTIVVSDAPPPSAGTISEACGALRTKCTPCLWRT